MIWVTEARLSFIFGLISLVFLTACSKKPVNLDKADLFVSGEGNYAFYRIPGIVVSTKGTVLAYCEARKDNRHDWSTLDVLMKRSTDGGDTWSAPYVVSKVDGIKEENPVGVAAGYGEPYGPTYNNPVAIADRDGAVHLLYCLEYMRCFYALSEDDGISFSKPVEITAVFDGYRDEYDWKVISTGPGHGIQLKNGRLVVGVRLADAKGRSPLRNTVVSTIYSDDRGVSWKRGDIAMEHSPDLVNPNEPILVELSDGSVMLNARNESQPKRRLVTISSDGASGWSDPYFDEALLDSGVMASIIRASKDVIAFSNPHSIDKRENLTIKFSYDDGKTWSVEKVIEPGLSAYSDLAVLPDGTLLCFYERGSEDGSELYGRLTLADFRTN